MARPSRLRLIAGRIVQAIPSVVGIIVVSFFGVEIHGDFHFTGDNKDSDHAIVGWSDLNAGFDVAFVVDTHVGTSFCAVGLVYLARPMAGKQTGV